MKRLLALAAFQVITILAWASYHEYVWVTAPTFRIPLRPSDPFDIIRGRYFILNPQDASIDSRSGFLPREEVERFVASPSLSYFSEPALVGFCPAGDLYRVCALARPGDTSRGPARFWAKASATISETKGNRTVQLDLGLRRFFIPNRLQLPAPENQDGWELEVSHRPGLSLLPRRLFFKGTPLDLR